MAINVASLPAYVEQNTPLLLGKAIMGAKTINYMTLQTGIKSSAAINLLKTDMQFGDGSDCGWNEKGTDTFSQRTIVTGQIKVNKSYCDRKLIGKWAQDEVRIAAGTELLPFEERFMEANAQGIATEIEKCIWQGDTAKSGQNLGRFDGLIKILKNDGGVLDEEISAETSKIAAVKQVLMRIPAKALEGARIFAAPSFVRAYGQELVEKNFYHYEAGVDYNEFPIPASNVILTAAEGLEGTETSDYLVAAQPSNLFYGCDLEGDEEKFDFWYSKDNQEFRLAVKFNAGVQVAFPDEVVLGTIARA